MRAAPKAMLLPQNDSHKVISTPPPYTEFNVGQEPGPSSGSATVGALNASQGPSFFQSGPPTGNHPHPNYQPSATQPPRSPYPYLHHPIPVQGQYPFPTPVQNPYPAPLHPHGHHAFGPTPLPSAQPVLPYAFYQPSPDARARGRFVEALLCAVGVYFLAAFFVGAEVFGDGWFFRKVGETSLWAVS